MALLKFALVNDLYCSQPPGGNRGAVASLLGNGPDIQLTSSWFLSLGIDGPAAFMGSDVPDLGTKIQILSPSQTQNKSQSQPQSQSESQFQLQSQPQSPACEEPESDRDTETLLEPKTDIHELLQKQGESQLRRLTKL